MKRKLLLLMALGLVLVCCKGIGLQDDPITDVTGTITDSTSGLPVESASVWLDDSTIQRGVTSDSLGQYLISKMGNRPVTISCAKQDYRSQTKLLPSSGWDLQVSFLLSPDSLK